MSYLEQHKASGFSEGDLVIVTRKSSNYENGWDNSWVNRMDDFVDRKCVITNDSGAKGFTLKYENNNNYYGYDFPWFVLEKVEG
jgi:hypothetical protein